MPKYLRVPDVCRRFGVHKATVHRWISLGVLPGSFQVTPNGDWLIPSISVDRLAPPVDPEGESSEEQVESKTA